MSEFKIDGQTYKLVDAKFTFAEAKALERVTGHTFEQINSDENVRGSIGVVQALMWVSMKRVTPTLQFSDLDELAIDDIEWVEDEPVQESAAVDPTPPAEEAGEPSST